MSQAARHTLIYFAGRGLPAVANLCALLVYVRLLQPGEVALYIAGLAGGQLLSSLFFSWIWLSILRFRASITDAGASATIVWSCTIGGGAMIAVGMFGGSWMGGQPVAAFVPLVLGLAACQGFFQVTQDRLRADLRPMTYAVMLTLQSTIALLSGITLALIGFGPVWLLASLAVSFLFVAFVSAWPWIEHPRRLPDWGIVRRFAQFGIPMGLAAFLVLSLSTADRVLITLLFDPDLAGRYAANAELAGKITLTMLLVVNLAGYPLIVRAYERGGEADGVPALQAHLARLLIVGSPIVAAFWLYPEWIGAILLGSGYREMAAEILPLVASSCLLLAINAYVFVQAFHFRERIRVVLACLAIGGMSYVVLAVLLAQVSGPIGVVQANIVGNLVMAVACWLSLSRVWRRVAADPWLVAPILAAAAAFGPFAVLPGLAVIPAVIEIPAHLLLAFALYIAILMATNYRGIRSHARSTLAVMTNRMRRTS